MTGKKELAQAADIQPPKGSALHGAIVEVETVDVDKRARGQVSGL
jgi:hypothetical protein